MKKKKKKREGERSKIRKAAILRPNLVMRADGTRPGPRRVYEGTGPGVHTG